MRATVCVAVVAVLATTAVAAVWPTERDAREIPVRHVRAVQGVADALNNFFAAAATDDQHDLSSSTDPAESGSAVVEPPPWQRHRPETLGVAVSKDHALAGLKYPDDAAREPVFVAVLLTSERTGDWRVGSATTVCDPFGRGIVFSFDTDPALVLVLGGSAPGTAHVGPGIDLGADRPVMQVWEMPGLSPEYHVLAVNHREPAEFCST